MMVAGTLAGAEVARAVVDLRNACGSCHEGVRGTLRRTMTYIVRPPPDQAPARCRCDDDSSMTFALVFRARAPRPLVARRPPSRVGQNFLASRAIARPTRPAGEGRTRRPRARDGSR